MKGRRRLPGNEVRKLALVGVGMSRCWPLPDSDPFREIESTWKRFTDAWLLREPRHAEFIAEIGDLRAADRKQVAELNLLGVCLR